MLGISRSANSDPNGRPGLSRVEAEVSVGADAVAAKSPWSCEVLQLYTRGEYSVAVVQYAGEHHYEGRKILVFRGAPWDTLSERTNIDPHFSENDTTLIARFAPTDQGWDDAVSFCDCACCVDKTQTTATMS